MKWKLLSVSLSFLTAASAQSPPEPAFADIPPPGLPIDTWSIPVIFFALALGIFLIARSTE